MSIWPFQRSRAAIDAERLLKQVTAASRNPALYGPDRAPDTIEGRFEMAALYAGLALFRLRSDPAAAPLAQAFTDRFFSVLDAGLREAGVGDTAVPRRMRRLAGDFYGRLKAYSEAIEGKDQAGLARALGRNIKGDESHPFAAWLAERVAQMVTTMSRRPIGDLFGEEAWLPPG